MTPELLDQEVRRDLRGLPKDLADIVARHLVAAGELLDEDPEAALAHARFARHRASRVAVVREACGLAAYHAGEWAEALAELRASRRMGGAPHVPVMADAERALAARSGPSRSRAAPSRPTCRATRRWSSSSSPRGRAGTSASTRPPSWGSRSRTSTCRREDPWTPRLFYAYGEALLAAGRRDDAVRAFLDAAQTDVGRRDRRGGAGGARRGRDRHPAR